MDNMLIIYNVDRRSHSALYSSKPQTYMQTR